MSQGVGERAFGFGRTTGVSEPPSGRYEHRAAGDHQNGRDHDRERIQEGAVRPARPYSGSARLVDPVSTSARIISRILRGSSNKGLWADRSNV